MNLRKGTLSPRQSCQICHITYIDLPVTWTLIRHGWCLTSVYTCTETCVCVGVYVHPLGVSLVSDVSSLNLTSWSLVLQTVSRMELLRNVCGRIGSDFYGLRCICPTKISSPLTSRYPLPRFSLHFLQKPLDRPVHGKDQLGKCKIRVDFLSGRVGTTSKTHHFEPTLCLPYGPKNLNLTMGRLFRGLLWSVP